MIADVSTIVARGMGVRRGGRWVLRPAAFGIAEGVIGIAGPHGVGKTTLLATFATLRRPRVGSLEILGFKTGNKAGLRAARARIGYLPDHFAWAEHLSVRDFIAYAAYYKNMPKAAVERAVRRVDLTEVAGVALGRLPDDLRLRAGLAATCVHAPDLVLLDDPFAGLDDGAAAELSPLLHCLAGTVLLTDRDAGRLASVCDRVYGLARGRLAEITCRPAGAPRRREPTLAELLAPAHTGYAPMPFPLRRYAHV